MILRNFKDFLRIQKNNHRISRNFTTNTSLPPSLLAASLQALLVLSWPYFDFSTAFLFPSANISPPFLPPVSLLGFQAPGALSAYQCLFVLISAYYCFCCLCLPLQGLGSGVQGLGFRMFQNSSPAFPFLLPQSPGAFTSHTQLSFPLPNPFPDVREEGILKNFHFFLRNCKEF